MHSASRLRQQMSLLFARDQQFQTELPRVIICLIFKIPIPESISEVHADQIVGDSKWLVSSCFLCWK